MALQGNQPRVLDLNFAYSAVFAPAVTLKERFRPADLTQEGHLRGRFKPNQRIPIVPSYKAKILNVTATSTLGQILGHEGVDAISPVLTITFPDDFIARSQFTPEAISLLQKALKPQDVALTRDVLENKEWKDGITSIGKAVDIAIGSLFAAIIDLGSKDNEFFNLIVSSLGLDETTTRLDESLKPARLRDAPYGTISYILAKKELSISNDNRQRINDWFLFKENKFAFEDFILELPTFQPLFDKVKRKLEVSNFKKPEFVRFKEFEMLKALDVKITWTGIDVPAENTDFAYEAGLWIYFSQQSAETDANVTLAFASTRVTLMKYGLFVDSDEMVKCAPVAEHDVTLASVSKLESHFEFPDTWLTGIVVSAISYLKSGHHATATGLTNQMTRILNALGISTATLEPEMLIRASVYHGAHVGSMRLIICFLREMARSEALSGAIGYRLYPVPPMFAAYCNLEVFIESLNASNFFKFMDREHEYKKFKDAMTDIRKDMHYCAPYSAYLYGEVRKDPQSAKALAAELASYASAIASIMPNSSLIASPSLHKLAEQNSQNSISAKLMVDAYVSGYRRFFRSMMMTSLQTKMIGSKAPSIGLLE